MLQTIKEYIRSGLTQDFATYYQSFVVDSQDQIIDTIASKAQSEYFDNSLDCSIELIKGMNALAQELKTL